MKEIDLYSLKIIYLFFKSLIKNEFYKIIKNYIIYNKKNINKFRNPLQLQTIFLGFNQNVTCSFFGKYYVLFY